MRILGVIIAYTDNLFATRCPVRYLLEPCDPKMGWKFEWEDPKTKAFSIVSQSELQKRLISPLLKEPLVNILFLNRLQSKYGVLHVLLR